MRRFALFLRCRFGSEFDEGFEVIVLSSEDSGLMLTGVYKSRLGARPPRKRSAPVAGKWIRTDETPLLAGFRMCGGRGTLRREHGPPMNSDLAFYYCQLWNNLALMEGHINSWPTDSRPPASGLAVSER